MTNPARPSRPILGPAPEQESQVVRCSAPAEGASARPRLSSRPHKSPHERLAEKLKRGQELLGELPASNEHARLLAIAVMRRDEGLLDGVLSALGIEI
jgi:hypothetical protein